MSDNFSTCSLQWAALSAQALGWRPDEFWDATPADLRNALGPPNGTARGLTGDDLARLIERDNHG